MNYAAVTFMLTIALVFLAASVRLVGKEMIKMKNAILALQGAVSDNTAATNAAVSALGSGAASPADLAALADATAQIVKNTGALVNATPTGV